MSSILSTRRRVGARLVTSMIIAVVCGCLMAASQAAGAHEAASSCPSDAPLTNEIPGTPQVFAYRPHYRSVSYLTGILAPLVSGTFVSQVHHESSSGMGVVKDGIPSENDIILFRGSQAEVALIRQVLPQIDTRLADVMAHGVVYEVQRHASDGSAFDLVLSVLAGQTSLNLDLGAGAQVAGGAVLSLRNASLQTVLSALSSDTRFRMLSNPRLRIRSGRSAHFSVGEEVPTLAAIAYPDGANGPVQSVKYQAAGVIFDITPTVRDDQIEVQLRQQVSDFVPTESGVNGSPTLTKREIATSVVVDDGELIMIGGLQRQRREQGRHGLGFLPDWLGARTQMDEDSEIIVLLQVNRIRPH